MVWLISTPFLAHVIKLRPLQVVRRHDDSELDIRLERQKPRLGQRRNPGRVSQIDDEHRSPLSILLGEIGRLRLEGFEDAADFCADRAVLDRGIEGLVWDFDMEHHSHDVFGIGIGIRIVGHRVTRSLAQSRAGGGTK